MKLWNVHRTDANRLQNLLNDHAARGWDVHHVRGVGNNAKESLMVVFVRDFADEAGLNAYLVERDARGASRKLPVAEPVPA